MLTLVKDLHKLFRDKNQTDEYLASMAFEEMDTNNGSISSKEEFVTFYLKQKNMSSCLAMKIFNLFDE